VGSGRRLSEARILYQAVGSSECAICAVGNLLLLYGTQYGREDVRELFWRVTGRAPPAITHSALLNVVSSCTGHKSLQWRCYSRFSFDRLSKAAATILQLGAPALLTFHMRHITRDWSGVHCVVVVDVDQSGIHVIDSLGRRDGHRPNATILAKESDHGWRVKGAPLIVTRRPTRILQGLPSLRKLAKRIT
jgi:hypothetical protein